MATPPSALGRLLQEVSWEGNARHYRDGGRGFENVLTAEVFQSLDFLPRNDFLGRIIRSADCGATATMAKLANQIEGATFSLLPGDIFLSENPIKGESPLYIQPDGIIQTPGVYCLLEAKRIRRGAFQPEQLAREYLTVLQEAKDRDPLLLLVLPQPPPIPVRAHGRLSVHDSIAHWVEPVAARAEAEFPPVAELLDRIDSTVACITWSHIEECVIAGLRDIEVADPSVVASVTRLVQSVLGAIEWHS